MLSPALSAVNITTLRRVLLTLNPGEFPLSFQRFSAFSLPLQIVSSSSLMFLILQLLFLGQVSLLSPTFPPPSLTLCFTLTASTSSKLSLEPGLPQAVAESLAEAPLLHPDGLTAAASFVC